MKSPNPTDLYVGQQIRERRQYCGYSQVQLGKSIDVTFQQIQKYEKATNRVSPSKLFGIAKFLGVPVMYFLPCGGSTKPAFPNEVPFYQRHEILRLFSEISCAKTRKKFLELLRTIARPSAPNPSKSREATSSPPDDPTRAI